MDEILSSIRQIIADDDATAALPPPAPVSAAAPREILALPETSGVDAAGEGADALPAFDDFAESQPLALTPEQMLPDDEPRSVRDALDLSAFAAEAQSPSTATPAGEAALKAEFVDPEDISFEPDHEAMLEPPVAAPAPVQIQAAVTPRRPAAVALTPQRESVPRSRPTTAQAAPMPDPTLSRDIAEELLEPATNAAVRANFSRLANLGIGSPGLTIEAMMRDMLRPMLKEWLDENLPSVVERMVEKEIARISRGVE